MKIKIVCQLQSRGYSGGRYYAIMLAAGLSRNNDVHFFTNSPKNQIYDECFKYANISFRSYNSTIESEEFDISIIFPGGEKDFSLHENLLKIAKLNCKKTFLFSFETENWWNSFNIEKKSSLIWSPWKKISENVDGIICVSKECVKWSREFYEKDESFPFFYIEGPINSFMCDSVPNKQKKDQICFFTRIGINSSHKGFKYLHHLNNSCFSNHKIKVVFGGQKPNKKIEDSFKKLFQKNKIEISFLDNLREEEKFSLLKESKILFYPESFTGFGLPPLEAVYCETRPLCFDIPVIRKNDVGLFRYMSLETMSDDLEKISYNYKFDESDLQTLEEYRKKMNIHKYCENLLKKIMKKG